MSDLREADASPPPEVRPERPQRSPRRNLSAVSIEEQKTWPHNRLGSVGLDAVGEFTRRKQDYQKSWNESQGTMRSATLASLAQEENRRRSMPSGSSSSSSSHSASATSHRSAKHSPRAASLTNAPVSTIRRKTALADPSRNQRVSLTHERVFSQVSQ